MSDPSDVTARIARDVIATIEADLPKLGAIDEERASEPRAPGKWSRKQVIGHLIDSAFNNQQRFVRAQLGTSLAFPGYAQESWVATQAYQRRRPGHAAVRGRGLRAPPPPSSGAGLAASGHQRGEWLNPEAAAGKTHLPYA